jgi:oligopeptide transport system ATP-binding protein
MTDALAVRSLSVRYGAGLAVRGIDLTVPRGSVVALIGESGCGKTSVALACVRLLPASARVEGQILVNGTDVVGAPRDALRSVRAGLMGFVAQDAMAALNPVVPVGRQIAELFQVHQGLSRGRAASVAVDTLRRVRIDDAARVARQYPHQLSGGMRQRVMVAAGLALSPALLVADEPTTALDVSTQAEILGLVRGLRDELGMGILWITHDMGVVAELADRVAVMYAGTIVEEGPVERIFDAPAHPYTAALLATLRDLRDRRGETRLFQIEGQPPSLDAIPSGCPFHPRCSSATDRCTIETPRLERHGDHAAACHHPLVEVAVPR